MGSDQKIRSKPIKKIKKKSNFTCTLEHDQPPSDQNRSKKSKKKSNFTCTLEHDQPPSDQKIRSKPIKTDQKNQKKIKFHLYTRARSTLQKKSKKNSNFTCTLEHDQPPSDQNQSKKSKKNQISP